MWLDLNQRREVKFLHLKKPHYYVDLKTYDNRKFFQAKLYNACGFCLLIK